MAVITPNTDVILLKVPLEISEDHQLTFANATAQFNYFNGLTGKLTLDKFTYARKDGVLRVPYGYDDVISYNYVMYKNTSYGNKWFYAFITGAEYLNDGATALSIKTDVFQTYQFDLTYKKCLIEREHTNDDSFGSNTVPEGLETGEAVRMGGQDFTWTEFYLAFQVTELISNMADGSTGGRVYDGIYNGLIVVLVDSYPTADLLVAAYDDAGKRDAIVSCFYVPKSMVASPYTDSGVILHGTSCTIYFPNPSSSGYSFAAVNVTRPTTLDGYTPKNNKMFTKEFCYLYATNYVGGDAIYAFEDFRDAYGNVGTAQFQAVGTICQGCSIKVLPTTGYKWGKDGYLYGNGGFAYALPVAKLPLCSWNSDYYTNWVTQNSVNFATETPLSIARGFASGGIIGGITSLLGAASDIVNRQYEASLVPNQAKGNVGTGDVNFSNGRFFTVYAMTIKAEYARICDEFLSTFGYKTNRVKIPNITGRRNWNFVKTVGCYITADIPQEDLQEIKSMFDKGITLWHNPLTFLDYSQTNDIIS